MDTLNFSVNGNASKIQAFTRSAATALDKLFFAIYAGAIPICIKKSAAAGGSAEQIAIAAGTGYTVYLSEADTVLLPNVDLTYKLKIINDGEQTDLFGGTVTLGTRVGRVQNAAASPKALVRNKISQVFTGNDDFAQTIPAGAFIAGIRVTPVGVGTNACAISVDTSDGTGITGSRDIENIGGPVWVEDDASKIFTQEQTVSVAIVSNTDNKALTIDIEYYAEG